MGEAERIFLEKFVVGNQDLERLESLLAEFNIFEAIGAVRQELRHSDFLAFLLNPLQNHGLDDLFLKRFLTQVLLAHAIEPPVSVIDIDASDWMETEVLREWRGIDILIHNAGHRLVCAIENKIGSTEHAYQTRRYRGVVSREFPDCRRVFVYLTPEGEEPADEEWIVYSYTKLAHLLDRVSQSSRPSLGTDVYTLIRHYVAMLRRQVVSDSEIIELCRKIYRRHRQALDLIFEHRRGRPYSTRLRKTAVSFGG